MDLDLDFQVFMSVKVIYILGFVNRSLLKGGLTMCPCSKEFDVKNGPLLSDFSGEICHFSFLLACPASGLLQIVKCILLF